MDIQWLGHAGVRISSGGTTLYIDPSAMDYLGSAGKRVIEGLEPGDVILFTHGHDDHCDMQTAHKLTGKPTALFGPEGCAGKAGDGFKSVASEDMLELGPFKVRVVPAYNIKRERAPGTPFHPKGTGVGYVVSAEGKSVYHAGDTEPIPEMRDFGPVDVALVPVDGHFTMSADEAAQVAIVVRARTLVPIHFFTETEEMVRAAAARHEVVRIRFLHVGEAMEVD